MRVTILLLLAGLVCPHFTAWAQVVNTMPTQSSESYFLYEVKLIDEFIERFNDDPQSYLRQQSKANLGTDSMITRVRLVKSLFSRQQSWGYEVTEFLNDVTNSTSPTLLSFTDSSWYAEAQCIFTSGKAKIEVPLILHIHTEQGSSRWMIAGIDKCKLPVVAGKAIPGTAKDFIPTSSHGTNFIVFHRMFVAGMNPANYFEPQMLRSDRARQLVDAVSAGKLRFQQVKEIKYHFFQVPGWVFTASRVRQKSANSGWLITNLQKADEAEKKQMLIRFLNP